MPTIDQLDAAAASGDTDSVPVSQGGIVRRVSRLQLLASTQPTLAVASGLRCQPPHLDRASSGFFAVGPGHQRVDAGGRPAIDELGQRVGHPRVRIHVVEFARLNQ